MNNSIRRVGPALRSIFPRCATILVLPLFIFGCDEPAKKVEDVPPPDESWATNSYQDSAVNAAIVAQHTLYPYHFTVNHAELNDLGLRDLSVLADHFRQYPGDLNVRRGSESPELYEARGRHVIDMLTKAGVAQQRIKMGDGLPGGEGMPSERLLYILDPEKAKAAAASHSETMQKDQEPISKRKNGGRS